MIFQAETVRTIVQSKVPAETGESGEGRAAESKVRTLLRALLFVFFCLSVGPPNLLADLFSLIYAYILFYNC